MLYNRQNLILGGDSTKLTPRFLSLPHIFHLIRERCQVVPEDYHRRCLRKILKSARLDSEVLSVDCDPDLGNKAFNRGVF